MKKFTLCCQILYKRHFWHQYNYLKLLLVKGQRGFENLRWGGGEKIYSLEAWKKIKVSFTFISTGKANVIHISNNNKKIMDWTLFNNIIQNTYHIISYSNQAKTIFLFLAIIIYLLENIASKIMLIFLTRDCKQFLCLYFIVKIKSLQ